MNAASTVIGIAAVALGVALSILGAVGACLWATWPRSTKVQETS